MDSMESGASDPQIPMPPVLLCLVDPAAGQLQAASSRCGSRYPESAPATGARSTTCHQTVGRSSSFAPTTIRLPATSTWWSGGARYSTRDRRRRVDACRAGGEACGIVPERMILSALRQQASVGGEAGFIIFRFIAEGRAERSSSDHAGWISPARCLVNEQPVDELSDAI